MVVYRRGVEFLYGVRMFSVEGVSVKVSDRSKLGGFRVGREAGFGWSKAGVRVEGSDVGVGRGRLRGFGVFYKVIGGGI